MTGRKGDCLSMCSHVMAAYIVGFHFGRAISGGGGALPPKIGRELMDMLYGHKQYRAVRARALLFDLAAGNCADGELQFTIHAC
jgi:hypothetical protein